MRLQKGAKSRIVLINPPTAPRAQTTGKGREGVNPSPGTGVRKLGEPSTRPEARGLGGYNAGDKNVTKLTE